MYVDADIRLKEILASSPKLKKEWEKLDDLAYNYIWFWAQR